MEGDTIATEVLVLSDGAGKFYMIPRKTVESYKLPAVEGAAVEQALGDDVTGYIHGRGQVIVDRVDTMGSGLLRAEEMRGRQSGASAHQPATSSMLPLTALTGFFTVVHDLERYLSIEQSNIRLG